MNVKFVNSMTEINLDNSVAAFYKNGKYCGKNFLLYKSKNTVYAVKNTRWNRIVKWILEGWWRNYDFALISKALIRHQLNKSNPDSEVVFFRRIATKFERYAAKRADKVAADVFTGSKREPQAKSKSVISGISGTYFSLFSKYKGVRDAESVWDNILRTSADLKSFPQFITLQSQMAAFKKLSEGMKISVGNFLYPELQEFYLTVQNSQIKKYFPNAPILPPVQEIPFKAMKYSQQEVDTAQGLIAQISQVQSAAKDPTLAGEWNACALFLLANCQDVIKHIDNKLPSQKHLEELARRLIRYREALLKFPAVIAKLNTNLMTAVKARMDLPVEKKQLLIVFGDSFLKDSGLEGDKGVVPYALLAKAFLEKSQMPLKNPKLPAILENVIDLRNPKLNIHQAVSDQVAKNGKCLIACGWSKHAMTLSIEPDRNSAEKKYIVRVFNSGAGLEFHPSAVNGLKAKSQSYIEIKNVDEGLLLKTNWLNQLQELDKLAQSRYELLPQTILYKALIPLLGGEISEPNSDINDLITPQRSGTCTWKALFAFLAIEMGKLPAKAFKFKFKSEILAQYLASLQKKMQAGQLEKDIEGLARAVKKFSASIKKIRANGLAKEISSEEIKGAQELIESAENLIIQFTAQRQLAAKSQKSPAELLAAFASGDKTSIYDAQFPVKSNPVPDGEEYAQKIHNRLENQLLDWEPRSKTIVSDIKNLYEICTSKENQSRKEEAIKFYELFVVKLIECDPENEILWNHISVQEAREMIKILHLASKNIYAYVEEKHYERFLDSEKYQITNLHILFVMQTLASKLSPEETLLYKLSVNAEKPPVQLNAMCIPQPFHYEATWSNKLNFNGFPHGCINENSFFRFFNNPKLSQYLARLSQKFPNAVSPTLFTDGFIQRSDNFRTLLEHSPLLCKAVKMWLNNKENYEATSKKLPGLRLDGLDDAYWIDKVIHSGVLPPVFQLLHQHARLVDLAFSNVQNIKEEVFVKSHLSKKYPLKIIPLTNDSRQLKFANTLPAFKNAALERFCYLLMGYRKRENIVLENAKEAKEMGLSLEEYRRLLSIRSARDFQIPLTLDYFFENLNKLKDTDYQSIFKSLLFEGVILIDDLQASPQRAQRISEFLQKAYTLFESQKEMSACAFILEIAASLRDYSNGQIAPWDDQRKFLEAIAKAESLSKTAASQQDLSVLHAAFLAAFSGRIGDSIFSPSKELLKNLLKSRQFLIQYPLEKESQNERRDQAIKEALFYLQGKLEYLWKTDKERDDLLNAFITQMGKVPYANGWRANPKFPIFSTLDNAFQINISTGDILCLKDQTLLQKVPQVILGNESFNIVFGAKKNGLLCKVLTPTLFEIQDQDYLYRVRNEADGKVALFRQFGTPKEWFKFVHDIPQKEQAPSAIMSAHESWVSVDNNNSPQTIYFVDSATKAPIYIRKDNRIFKIARNKSLDWQYVNIQNAKGSKFDSAYQFLTHFENDRHIHLWHHNLEKKLHLELLRYGLNFDLDLSQEPIRWASREYPQYFLSPVQSLPILGNLQGALLLQNQKGEKKVLIPNRAIDENGFEGNSLNFPVSFWHETSGNPPYFEYSVTDKGALLPNNFFSRVHLAFIFLTQSRYQEAFSLLNSAFIEIQERPLTADEVFALKRLTQLKRDLWGEAIAVRLRGHYLLEKNRRLFGNEGPLNEVEAVVVYKRLEEELKLYYDHMGNVGSVSLQEFEEAVLIKTVLNLPKLTKEPIHRTIANRAGQLGLSQKSSSDLNFPECFNKQEKLDLNRYIQYDTLEAFISAFVKRIKEVDEKDVKGSEELGPAFFSDDISRTFALLYPKLRAVKTLEQKRQFFVDLYPLCLSLQDRIMPNIEQTAAAVLIAIAFKPELFPQTLKEFKNKADQHWLYSALSSAQLELKYSCDEAKKWLTTFAKDNPKKIPFPSNPTINPRNPVQMPQMLKASGNAMDVIQSFDAFFNVDIQSPLEKEAVEKEFNGIFSSQHPEAADEKTVRHYYTAMREDISKFLSQELKTYRFKFNKIHDLLASLQKQQKHEDDTIQFQEMRILHAAHKESNDPAVRSLFSSGKKTYPSIEELFIYFGQANWDGLKERNPALTDNDIISLRSMISSHLISKTKKQKISRSLALATKLNENKIDSKQDEIVQDLANELSASRMYDENEFPAFLAFEYFSNLLIRQDQIDDMKIFFQGKVQPARQKIMGAGKTTILAPLIGLLRADGKRLSSVIVPESLVSAAATTLRHALGAGFHKPFCYISFHRDHLSEGHLKKIECTSEEYLKSLLEQLQNAISHRQVTLMTPQTRHSLINAFEEALAFKKLSDQSLGLLREISILIHTSSIDLIDEIDQVLNPRTEFNYSLGGKTIYNEAKGRLISRITLEACKYPFIHEEYHAKTKSMLTEFALKELSLQSRTYSSLVAKWNPVEREYAEFYLQGRSKAKEELEKINKGAKISDKVLAQIESLLKNNPKHNVDPLLGILSRSEKDQITSAISKKIALENTIADFIKSLDPGLRESLATACVVINSVLPNSLRKVCNEQYGARKDPMNLVACPYEASNAPKRTEYATPEEQIAFSIQTLFVNGIPDALIHFYCQRLYDHATKESGLLKIPLDQTEGFKQFDLLRGLNKSISFEAPSNENIKAIKAYIKLRPELLLIFSDRFLLPKIETYESKISSNPYKLAGSAFSAGGFTGTLEPSLLPNVMAAKPEEGTSAKIMVAIGKKVKANTSTISFLSETKGLLSDQILRRLATEDTHHVLIDSGGWLKNVKIPEFAKQLLEQTKRAKIKGVIFHDENGRLLSLEKSHQGFITIPLIESSLQENERLTIIAQKYCTGTNIKQSLSAKALKTTGKNETLRDFLQSVFRLRGILKNQDVEMLISDEAAAEIRQTLGLSKTDPIGYSILLRFYATAQSLRVADDNLLAMKQKMDHVIQDIIKRQILSPENSLSHCKNLFDSAKEFFVQKESTELYPAHDRLMSFETADARIDRTVETYMKMAEALLKRQENCINVIKEACKLGVYQLPPKTHLEALSKFDAKFLKDEALKALRNLLHSSVNKHFIREILPSSTGRLGKETEVEKQKETEKEQEQESENIVANPPRITSQLWQKCNDDYHPDLLEWKINFKVWNDAAKLFTPTADFPFECHLLPLRELFLKNASAANSNTDFCTKYSKVYAALHPNLLCSLDFLGKQSSVDKDGKTLLHLNPFDITQKNASQILVFKEGNSATQTVLTSLSNILEIKKAIRSLKKEEKEKLFKESFSIAVYDPISGIDVSFGSPANPKIDRDLFEQIVQIKFINGTLHFEPDEIKYLYEWLKANDTKALYDFYINRALAYKSDSRRIFMADSFLKRMFNEILKSPSN